MVKMSYGETRAYEAVKGFWMCKTPIDTLQAAEIAGCSPKVWKQRLHLLKKRGYVKQLDRGIYEPMIETISKPIPNPNVRVTIERKADTIKVQRHVYESSIAPPTMAQLMGRRA